jgi:hypothetical protein
MARKKKKTRNRAARAPRDWSAVRRWAYPALAILCVGALGAGMTIGVNRLDRGARRVLAASGPEVQLLSPGDLGGQNWVRDEDLALLENRVEQILAGADPFAVAPLEDVSTMLGRSGWFRAAPRVERVGRRTVRIAGDWRTPAAVVRSGGRDHLISWEGLPMPPVFSPGGSQAPIILGARLAPLDPSPETRYARPWPGDDVAAGLDLLRLLALKPYRSQVAAVDVGGLARGQGLALITDRETRVLWGGRPGRFNAGEVSDDEKLARLNTFFEREGRIDGGFDEIEIQGPTILRRRADPEP